MWRVNVPNHLKVAVTRFSRADTDLVFAAMRAMAGDPLSGALRADFWQSFRRFAVRDHIARMCGGYQGSLPRLPALYPRIRCPTLVLWGERDKHFPLAHAARLHAAIEGSRLEVLPGGEHWMAWHAADEVALRIRRFASAAVPGV